MTEQEGLWAWAVEAYGRAGVEEACLELQDARDQNVPFLLWAAWAAATGRALDADALEEGADTARSWEENATEPLRAIRRKLKGPIPDIDDEARKAVREQVKAVELESERRLLAQLEALAPQAAGAARPMLAALVDAARAWGPTTPRAALENLTVTLSA